MTSPTPAKLRPEHLNRQAFVYVRQSTLLQVREHTASTARQYHLVERARALEAVWQKTTVLCGLSVPHRSRVA